MEPRQTDDPARVGPYRVVARLGEGGMGVVYLARSRGGQKVAVKVIRAGFTDNPEYRERFRREVHAARRVTGTFIAPVLEAAPDPKDGPPWLATEYLPGLSLREAVHWFGGLPPDAVRALAAGLAEALTAIHRAGVVHRDLKPENIILTAGGPRVIDFGIARPDDVVTVTRAGMPIGTPGYMSPEQASGGKVGPAGDLFTLGTVLAYAATGREPFGSGSVQSKLYRVRGVRTDLSGISEPWLLDLIMDCHHEKPGRRPSAAEVVKRLGRSGDGELSLQGTRWLPAPIAEAIDRLTSDARGLPEFPVAPARRAAHQDTTVQPPDATVQPPEAVPAGGRDAVRLRRPSRRAVLGGMGVLGAAALTADRVPASRRGGGTPEPVRRSPAPIRPSPPVALRWRRKVGDYYSDLIISDGIVLAKESASPSVLHALDPHTGRTLWKRNTFINPRAFGDVVYQVPPEVNRLVALRGRSGATLWSHPLNRSGDGFPSMLVVTESVICYGVTRLTAIDARDRRLLWTADVSPQYGLSAGAGIVAAASKKVLVGLSARSGRVRWKYDVDDGFSPIVGYGMVFVWDRLMTLHALRAGDGTVAWKRPDSGYQYPVQNGHPPLWGGNLYASRPDGTVLALRAATGEPVWWRRLGHGEGAPYSRVNTLGIYGDTLYVGGTDRHVYAVNPADGRVLWSYRADVTMTSPPVGVAGLVFIGTREGYVEALSPPRDPSSPSGGARAHP